MCGLKDDPLKNLLSLENFVGVRPVGYFWLKLDSVMKD